MSTKRQLTIAVTLCCGGLLSSAAAIAIVKIEKAQQQQRFSQHVDSLTALLQGGFNRHSEVLPSLSAFISASSPISETEFQAFAQPYLDTHSGIETIKWAPVISAENRAQFESETRFQIVEAGADGGFVTAAPRDEYIPVVYEAPWGGDEKVIPHGLDLGADDRRRQVLDNARDSRALAASGRIPLVQSSKGHFGLLMSLPIFPPVTGEQLASLSVQQGAVQQERNVPPLLPVGYVVGVFRISDVIEGALAPFDYDIDLSIHDRTASPARQFLGTYDAASDRMTIQAPRVSVRRIPHLCPHPHSCLRTLSIGGREWSIAFAPSQTYPLFSSAWPAVFAVAVGSAITFLLLAVLLRSQTAIDRLRNTNDFKLRFFSMASQELRPHLTTIRMCTRALASEPERLSSSQLDILGRCLKTSTDELFQLSDDILTLARVEGGLLEFAPSAIDLDALCKEIVGKLQVELKHPGIFYENLAEIGWVYLDPLLLRALLMNLLSNAVKYSSDDSIVHLMLKSANDNLEIRVSDSGIGIPKSTRQQLFKSFVRGKNVGKIPGTGLGLQIVKSCVDLHGGTIMIDSEVDVGTMVTVKLPLFIRVQRLLS
ncbi:MAG: CHASE domain-containing protein [Cyanobacteria bacterium P01_E01_bin.34]